MKTNFLKLEYKALAFFLLRQELLLTLKPSVRTEVLTELKKTSFLCRVRGSDRHGKRPDVILSPKAVKSLTARRDEESLKILQSSQ